MKGGYEVTQYGLRSNHPAYCTCVDCNNHRLANLNRRPSILARLADKLRPAGRLVKKGAEPVIDIILAFKAE